MISSSTSGQICAPSESTSTVAPPPAKTAQRITTAHLASLILWLALPAPRERTLLAVVATVAGWKTVSHALRESYAQPMARLEPSLDTPSTPEMATTPPTVLSSRISLLALPVTMLRPHPVCSTDSLNALLVSLARLAQKALARELALRTLSNASLATTASARLVLATRAQCTFVSTPAPWANISRQEAARLRLTARHAQLASTVLLDRTVNVTAHLDTTVRQARL